MRIVTKKVRRRPSRKNTFTLAMYELEYIRAIADLCGMPLITFLRAAVGQHYRDMQDFLGIKGWDAVKMPRAERRSKGAKRLAFQRKVYLMFGGAGERN
ncbi:MAG TPA: hypothetical protein VH619_18880 [Verrucomicrobiae bacterium]|jgi:hypothetical protein|nr:hypothetical protein [Verrucomicrobiae bacterium]